MNLPRKAKSYFFGGWSTDGEIEFFPINPECTSEVVVAALFLYATFRDIPRPFTWDKFTLNAVLFLRKHGNWCHTLPKSGAQPLSCGLCL